MTAEKAPYCIVNDDIVMSLFVFSLVGIAYIFLISGSSIVERLKSMFYYGSKQSSPYSDRTHISSSCNALLYWQTVFYYGIVTFTYMQLTPEAATTGRIPHHCLAAYTLLFTAALIAKKVIYDACNVVLFGNEVAQEWSRTYFFTLKMTGFLLLPVIGSLFSINDLNITYLTIYLLFVTVIYVIAYISNAIKIIFRKKCNYLDIFLYLCALELLPMAILWKTIHSVNSFLTIKF